MTAIKKNAPAVESKVEDKKVLVVKPASALFPVPAQETKSKDKPAKPAQEAQAPQPAKESKAPSLEELKRRAEIVFLLREKHTQLTAKRASLDKFTISHEKENATATVEDVNGMHFTSSSPKTIAKLLEFWKQEFDEAIAKVEDELKRNFDFVA